MPQHNLLSTVAESLNNLIKVSVKRLSGQDIFIKSGEMTQNSKTRYSEHTSSIIHIANMILFYMLFELLQF